MTEQDLIKQLKSLKTIHPDSNWVNLTRSKLVSDADAYYGLGFSFRNALDILGKIFSYSVPKPVAVSALAAFVALVGGVSIYNQGLIEEESGTNYASVAGSRAISDDTVVELNQIAASVTTNEASEANAANEPKADYTVVFNEDSEERDNFQDSLRARIESKISGINDLFSQLDDGALALEISLNQRRYEKNFKLADEELANQVKGLLADAQEALDGGDLIDALELVNAAEKLFR